MKLRKGDTVLIISGKDRGKKGKIIEVLPEEEKIVVEGINLRKRHLRPKTSGEKGQIIEKPASFFSSRAKIICSKCGKAVRISCKVGGEKKYRVCKKCGQET